MTDYQIFERINRVEKLFKDENSKIILRSRILFNLTGDIRQMHRMLKGINFPFDKVLEEYEHMEETYVIFPEKDMISFLLSYGNRKDIKVILFGCGYESKNFISLLEVSGYEIIALLDNNKEKIGSYIEGYKIQGIDEVNYMDEKTVFVISAPSVKEEIKNQLISLGIESDRIYSPPQNALVSFVGPSYFEDFLSPQKDEVFIDAGCYNGGTCLDFIKWCPYYKKIYAFEPGADNFKKCEKTIMENNISKVELRNTGLWNKKEELTFLNAGDNGTAGHIVENWDEVINAEPLDLVVKNDMVTFIKMDIEGAEMKALEGAKETIKRCKPRLAICVYHLNDDILDIPEYIHSLVPEYRMELRHYNTFFYDTVLYAWID